MRELIAIREVLREIQKFMIVGKNKLIQFNTHAKAFNLDTIPQSIVHEDNNSCLRFTNMTKMSPRTKHIVLPYHFFRIKVEDLQISVVDISTHDQLADQFTKGLTELLFVKSRKGLMGWQRCCTWRRVRIVQEIAYVDKKLMFYPLPFFVLGLLRVPRYGYSYPVLKKTMCCVVNLQKLFLIHNFFEGTEKL